MFCFRAKVVASYADQHPLDPRGPQLRKERRRHRLACSALGTENAFFCAILYAKTIIVLPRQARDRHGKSTTQKERDAFVSQPKIELATDFLLRMIQGCVETHLLFFEFSLCLSRACLGKMIICSIQRARLQCSFPIIRISKSIVCQDRLGTTINVVAVFFRVR